MMKKLILKSCVFIMMGTPLSVLANCYQVNSINPTSSSNNVIRPGEGVVVSWSACDTCNGSLGLPSVINLSDGGFIPHGTLIASGVAPFIQYGMPGGYDPETVFIRCAPEDDVYEMYSTNGDNAYSGSPGSAATGEALGLTATYDTAWDNILLRLTNVTEGEFFTDIWKERLLTDLDVDSRGYRLVKAKNLSVVRAEIYSSGTTPHHRYNSNILSQRYDYSQPNGYIALRGPGFSGPATGTSHASVHTGWPGHWPGAIGLYHQVTLKRYPTCMVQTVTPYVMLPTISRASIESGGTVEAPFQVRFRCQNTMIGGYGSNENAMGILVSPGAAAAAASLGMVNANTGVSHLLSDQYGEEGVAKGVGIKIHLVSPSSGAATPLVLLTNEDSGGGDDLAAINRGWRPVDFNSQDLGTSGGVTQYLNNYVARLEKLPGDLGNTVTSGKVKATAQIVIRVQ